MENSEFEKTAIASLRHTLMDALDSGKVEHWSTRNFEVLSDQIFERTSIRLSVSTLKRFMGKIAYDGKPAPATLDAIAAFVGYQNYSEYCSRIDRQSHAGLRIFLTRKVFIALVLGLTIAGMVGTWSFVNGSVSEVDPLSMMLQVSRRIG